MREVSGLFVDGIVEWVHRVDLVGLEAGGKTTQPVEEFDEDANQSPSRWMARRWASMFPVGRCTFDAAADRW